MVAEEESLREKGRAAPSPTTQALLRHTWEHREALNKVGHAEAGSAQAPCLLPVHIHSSPPTPNPIHSYMRESPGSCCAHFWYPGKVTACQEKNHTAKPLQAGLLNAQRAFSSREISQVGHQPRVGPESSLGPAMGPVIHIPGNLAVAELLIT